MEQKKKCIVMRCGFINKIKKIGLALILAAGAIFLIINAKDKAMVAMAISPIVSLKGKSKGLSNEEEELLGKFEDVINKGMSDFAAGIISKEEIDERMSEIRNDIKKSLESDFVLKKSAEEMEGVIREMGNEVKLLKEKGINLNPESELTKALDNILDSQKFKDFIEGVAGKRSGKLELNLKDIVSLTNNYRGNILTTQQSNRVIVDVNERRINMRDLITVEQGDPNFTSITYATITELDRNAAAVSENGKLPESSFKLKEVTNGLSRIGTHVNISKRLLKSRIYLRSFLLNRLPKWVRMAEDFQILFGDGQGDNLLGLAKNSFDIASWLTKNVVSGAAGDVLSVSPYNDGAATLIKFSKAFPKIEEGMIIKFSSAPSDSKLTDENILHKYNDREIMLEIPFSSIADNEVGALSFAVKNNFFNQVVDPTISDAINAGLSVLTYGEFTPNMIALNPSDVFRIETEKDTIGRSLGAITTNNGIKYMYGRPIVDTSTIAPGYYFMGDLANGASLVDYTTLTIEFAEDVDTKLQNYITVIAQEEVMMPIYNKFAFSYGKISDLLNAIKAPFES